MPSIRDVAKQAGVSIATVSRVLNGHQTVNSELREKVLKAAAACDYRPTVGKKTSERVALLYTGPFLMESPYD
ncbi:MAG: LacI family DNA-binding transcriptional regulator, partial [Planctomycetota bacterium]